MSTEIYKGTFPGNTALGTITDAASVGTPSLWIDRQTKFHNVSGRLAYQGAGSNNAIAERTEALPQDVQLVVTFNPQPFPASFVAGVFLKMQAHGPATAGACYMVVIYSGLCQISRFDNGNGFSPFSLPMTVPQDDTSFVDPGGPLKLEITATGTGTITFQIRVLKASDNTVLLDATASDTWGLITTPGTAGLWGTGGDLPADSNHVDAFDVYEFTGSSPLLPGTIELTETTADDVTLTMGAATGGVQDPPDYSWERSSDGFKTAGVAIPGETGLTLTYAHTDRTVQYFRGVATDGETTVYTNVLGACRRDPPIKIRLIGDSTTYGAVVPDRLKETLERLLGPVTVTVTNSAVNGSATSGWVPGQTNFDTMLAAALANGDEWADVTLGANDASGGNVSASLANMTLTVAGLTAAGIKVMLSEPSYIRPLNGGGGNAHEYMAAWVTALDSLCNGTTVKRGVRNAQRYLCRVAEAGRYLSGDAVHLSELGAEETADLRAVRLAQLIALETEGGGGTPGEVDDMTAEQIIDSVISQITERLDAIDEAIASLPSMQLPRGTANAGGSAGSFTATSISLSATTGAYEDGQRLLFLTGPLVGQSRPIASYSVSGGTRTFTFAAGKGFTGAPAAGNTFVIL